MIKSLGFSSTYGRKLIMVQEDDFMICNVSAYVFFNDNSNCI